VLAWVASDVAAVVVASGSAAAIAQIRFLGDLGWPA
jgi:hypothetical protein